MRLLARHYPSVKPNNNTSAAAATAHQEGQLQGQGTGQGRDAAGQTQQAALEQCGVNLVSNEEDGDAGGDHSSGTTGGSAPAVHAILMMPVRSTLMGAFPLSFTYFQVSPRMAE